MLVSVVISFLIIIISAAIPIVHFVAFPLSPFISGFIGASVGDLENEYFIEQDSDWHIEKLGQVYKFNDKRSQIKSEINKISGSNIKEIKKYTSY